MSLALAFGLLMAFAHYFSETVARLCHNYRPQIISLSGGIATTYLFLELIPRFSENSLELSKYLFLTILIGFSLLHVVEKYFHQHFTKKRFKKELAIEESSVIFFFHFMLGISAVMLTKIGAVDGILFFIPMLIYTVVSTLPLKQTGSKTIRTVIAFSTLIGVGFASIVYKTPDPLLTNIFLGFMIGALAYTVIRHSIPTGKKGKPLFFAIGVLVYIPVVIALSWSV